MLAICASLSTKPGRFARGGAASLSADRATSHVRLSRLPRPAVGLILASALAAICFRPPASLCRDRRSGLAGAGNGRRHGWRRDRRRQEPHRRGCVADIGAGAGIVRAAAGRPKQSSARGSAGRRWCRRARWRSSPAPALPPASSATGRPSLPGSAAPRSARRSARRCATQSRASRPAGNRPRRQREVKPPAALQRPTPPHPTPPVIPTSTEAISFQMRLNL